MTKKSAQKAPFQKAPSKAVIATKKSSTSSRMKIMPASQPVEANQVKIHLPEYGSGHLR